jgi:hypothetical protein
MKNLQNLAFDTFNILALQISEAPGNWGFGTMKA